MWRIWAAALFWGLNWPAVKIILGTSGPGGLSPEALNQATSGPWTLRAAGLAGGAGLLLAYAKASGRSLSVPRAQWRVLAAGGMFGVAGFNICTVFAQLSMPTSRAAILTFTMPLWVALFSWLFLAEKLDRLRLASLVVGALGLAVLSLPFWPVIANGGIPFGLVYVLGAAISWALGTVLLKRWPVTADPVAITAWQVVVAALICTVGLGLFERPHLDLTEPRVLVAFLYHITLPQAAAYVLWFSLVGRTAASTASLGTLLIPIFGVIGAIALLGEWPTPLDVAGLALILAAVAIDQFLRVRVLASHANARS